MIRAIGGTNVSIRTRPKAIDAALALLWTQAAVPLIDDAYISPSIVGTRTNAGMTQDATGAWVWAAHNYFLNSSAPATQTITTVVGEKYTFAHDGAGTITASGAGTGVSTGGAAVTIAATTTSLVLTVAGSVVNPRCCRGSSATPYVPTGASAVFPLRYNAYQGGYQLYDAATNLVANSSTPTATSATINGVAFTKVGEGYTGDLKYTDFSVVGTATAWAAIWPWPDITTTAGTFTVSAFCQLISGTPGVVKQASAMWDNWTGKYSTTTIATATAQRQTLTLTTATATNARLSQIGVLAGDTANAVIRVWHPQVESGATATPPIPTYGASATCAADVATIPLAATGLSDAAGCVVIRGKSASTDCSWLRFGSPYTGFLTVGGAAIGVYDFSKFALAGTYSANMETKVGSYGPEGMTAQTASASGAATYDGTMVTSTITIGSDGSGGGFINGIIQKLYTIPTQPGAATRAKLVKMWG